MCIRKSRSYLFENEKTSMNPTSSARTHNLKVPWGDLTTGSTMEQCYYKRVPPCLYCAYSQRRTCMCTSMPAMWYTFLRAVSRYSTDRQLAAMTHKKALQYAHKVREEECKLAYMDVNNTGSKIFIKSALQVFYDGGNTSNTSVRPLKYAWSILVRSN